MALPDGLTDQQRKTIEEYIAAFGRKAIKVKAPSALTGHVRVMANAHAGCWQWTIDRDGILRSATMDMNLFTDGDGYHDS